MIPTTSAYQEELGCNFTSAIPTNMFELARVSHAYHMVPLCWEDSHVIPGFIHKCLAKMNGTPFTQTGKPLMQFIYSIDLAELFTWMLREYDDVQ